MGSLHPQFDDPALKSALQRVWGGDTASPALRKRIEDTLLREKFADQSIFRRYRRPMMGLAAAAIVALVLSLSAVVVTHSGDSTLPIAFADAIVAAHDDCAAQTPHGQLADANNRDELRAIRSSLTSRLGYPVILYNPGADWKFDGFRICSVANIPAAHLLYSRGGETLSVFSISAAALYNDRSVREGSKYSQVDHDHAVAAFVYGGAVHCVVGFSPKKSDTAELAAVTAARDAMFASHPLTISRDVGQVSGK